MEEWGFRTVDRRAGPKPAEPGLHLQEAGGGSAGLLLGATAPPLGSRQPLPLAPVPSGKQVNSALHTCLRFPA